MQATALLFWILFYHVLVTINGCENDGIKFQNNCYYFQPNATSFPSAEITCSSMNGHLASIHDGFTNAILTGKGNDYFHTNSTTSDFWIGLNSLISPGNWTWTDGTILDFKEWAVSEPLKNLTLNCGTMLLKNGYWSAVDCYLTKPFVCQVPLEIYPVFQNCTPGYVYFEPTHSCYGLSNFDTRIYNWTLSDKHCEEEGANLASLHSYEETNFLSTYTAFAGDQLWIGLYSIDNEFTWHWTDGSAVDYLPWGSGYPHRNISSCAVLFKNAIRDIECGIIQYFLCKKPAL